MTNSPILPSGPTHQHPASSFGTEHHCRIRCGKPKRDKPSFRDASRPPPAPAAGFFSLNQPALHRQRNHTLDIYAHTQSKHAHNHNRHHYENRTQAKSKWRHDVLSPRLALLFTGLGLRACFVEAPHVDGIPRAKCPWRLGKIKLCLSVALVTWLLVWSRCREGERAAKEPGVKAPMNS